MAEATKNLESMKSELAELTRFMKEKAGPVHDERVRLRKALEGMLDEQKENRRADLIRNDDESADGIVRSGPYEGMDELDLGIMKSVHAAVERHVGPEPVREWDTRIKAAMASTGGGTGDELVPTGMARRLWEDVNLETRVVSLFPRIDMPTNPFEVPLKLGDVNWYPGAENTAVTGTALKTAKQTLTAYELVAEVPWSLALDEDAVVAMLPEVRRTLVRQAAEVMDDVALNADTTETNSINADGGAVTANTAGKAHYLIGFDGLIHLPLIDNTGQGTDFSDNLNASAFLGALKMLGKYGVNPNESVFIADVATMTAALGLAEVETLEKFGPGATILTGQLGSIYGHPLILSGQMLAADADGKVSDGGNTADRGRILAVNTSQWRVGFRRNLLIETDRDIQKRQNTMVVSFRLAFAERTGDRSSAKHTALVYNITT